MFCSQFARLCSGKKWSEGSSSKKKLKKNAEKTVSTSKILFFLLALLVVFLARQADNDLSVTRNVLVIL